MYANTLSICFYLIGNREYNAIEVSGMYDQTAVLQWAVVVAFVAMTLGFLIFIQNGGFLALAIEQAIEDGTVIVGMTKDDVISSWGHPYHTEEHRIQAMGVDELVALSWTYENRQRIVHFSSGGVVILVANWDG